MYVGRHHHDYYVLPRASDQLRAPRPIPVSESDPEDSDVVSAGIISPIALSDFFYDIMSEDSDQGHETPGTEETCDKGSMDARAKRRGDYESVGEAKVRCRCCNSWFCQNRKTQRTNINLPQYIPQATMPTSPPSAQPHPALFYVIPAPLSRTCEAQRL